MRFNIDWASLIVGSKFTVFALFYFVFEGNFLSTSPPGGLIHGGAYFRNFTVGTNHLCKEPPERVGFQIDELVELLLNHFSC